MYFNKKKYGFRAEHGSFTIKAPDHLPGDVLESIGDYVRSIDMSIHDEASLPDSINMESFWYHPCMQEKSHLPQVADIQKRFHPLCETILSCNYPEAVRESHTFWRGRVSYFVMLLW